MSNTLKLNWDDYGTLEDKVKALYNTHNWLTQEMSIGRVPRNRQDLQKEIDTTKTPLSIAFVKMAEKGDIDEVTATENIELFLEWDDKSSYKATEIRRRDGVLYQCLQDHTAQVGWEPENAVSLWKAFSVNENGIPNWSQPISQADSYMIDAEVMDEGKHWKSTVDYNVWKPGVYGWVLVEDEAASE